MAIEIREMDIDDLAQVFHMGETLFTSDDAPNLYRTWDEYEVIGLFQEDSDLCLVAEVAGSIVGFALGTTITKTRSAWKYGHLVWLAVAAEHQGTGVAEKLFNNFRDVMLQNGVRILLIDTEANNHAAIKFFERMGFGHPENHLYMALNLDAQLKELKKKMQLTSNR